MAARRHIDWLSLVWGGLRLNRPFHVQQKTWERAAKRHAALPAPLRIPTASVFAPGAAVLAASHVGI